MSSWDAMVVKEETLAVSATASPVLRKIELQVESLLACDENGFIHKLGHLAATPVRTTDGGTEALGGGAQMRDVSLRVATMAGEKQHLFSPRGSPPLTAI